MLQTHSSDWHFLETFLKLLTSSGPRCCCCCWDRSLSEETGEVLSEGSINKCFTFFVASGPLVDMRTDSESVNTTSSPLSARVGVALCRNSSSPRSNSREGHPPDWELTAGELQGPFSRTQTKYIYDNFIKILLWITSRTCLFTFQWGALHLPDNKIR